MAADWQLDNDTRRCKMDTHEAGEHGGGTVEDTARAEERAEAWAAIENIADDLRNTADDGVYDVTVETLPGGERRAWAPIELRVVKQSQRDDQAAGAWVLGKLAMREEHGAVRLTLSGMGFDIVAEDIEDASDVVRAFEDENGIDWARLVVLAEAERDEDPVEREPDAASPFDADAVYADALAAAGHPDALEDDDDEEPDASELAQARAEVVELRALLQRLYEGSTMRDGELDADGNDVVALIEAALAR